MFGAVECRLDAFVTCLDRGALSGVGEHVEFPLADRLQHALPDQLRREAPPRDVHRLLLRARIGATESLRPGRGRFEDVRLHRARAQHGNADAGVLDLLLQRLGQGDHRILGHRIRALVAATANEEAGDRRGVHHVSSLAMTDAVDHAEHVDPHHPVPLVVADVFHTRAVHCHAGIVYHDVQLAECPLCRAPSGRDGRGIGHIDRDVDRLRAKCLDVTPRRRQRTRSQVGQHEVHPRAGKGFRDASAYARRGTGHDRGLSL